jgi:hypothetical protein
MEGLSGTLILLIIVAIAFIGIIAYIFTFKPRKVAETEGFIVPVGAGLPDCSRTAPELADIVQEVAGTDSDDARELVILCGKLACMKTDLLSTAQLIQSSATQPFVSTHDRQPVTETLAQCFSRSMPLRDLDLIFELYLSRGVELIKRVGGSDAKCINMESKYKKVFDEVYKIAKQRCMADVLSSKVPEVDGIIEGDFAEYILGGSQM